jgi:hypothetical protein
MKTVIFIYKYMYTEIRMAHLHMHIQHVLDGRVVCLQNSDDDERK